MPDPLPTNLRAQQRNHRVGRGGVPRGLSAWVVCELVKKLWSQERLVFVGFGFTDPWFEVIADQVLTLTARPASGAPRHVAVVGLPQDQKFSPEIRRHFRDAYDAEVLLYPVKVAIREGVRHEDHRRLLRVLNEVGRSVPQPTVSQAAVRHDSERATGPFVERWVHETTEDPWYVEPAGVLTRLDRWADDPEVRVVGVTDIGGLGKTTLIGYWLKDKRGALRRPVKGLLCWSFNRNRDVNAFFKTLVEVAGGVAGVPAIPGQRRQVDDAVAALRTVPLVVVLDGLEVLQECASHIVTRRG